MHLLRSSEPLILITRGSRPGNAPPGSTAVADPCPLSLVQLLVNSASGGLPEGRCGVGVASATGLAGADAATRRALTAPRLGAAGASRTSTKPTAQTIWCLRMIPPRQRAGTGATPAW